MFKGQVGERQGTPEGLRRCLSPIGMPAPDWSWLALPIFLSTVFAMSHQYHRQTMSPGLSQFSSTSPLSLAWAGVPVCPAHCCVSTVRTAAGHSRCSVKSK